MEYPQLPGASAKAKRALLLLIRALLLVIPVALLLIAGLAVVFRVRRALDRASQTVATEGRLTFTLQNIDPASNPARGAGFEPVASAPGYTTGAFFAGDSYLAGPSGVAVIGTDGATRANLRTGIELPAAPVVAMAGARLRGASEPQLLLATSGAGLLLLQPGPHGSPAIRQLLTADAEARDLTALLPLATGDLLLGTRHRGALLYDGATLTPLRFVLPGVNSGSLQVTALAAVDAASFLVGTRDSGVFYFHAGTVDHANSSSGLPDDQVESIAVSGAPEPARAFVGTPVGTAEFDLAATSFRPVRTLAPGLFSHALAVENRQLVVGTLDEGIQRIPLDDHARVMRASISAGLWAVSAERIDAFIKNPEAKSFEADGFGQKDPDALYAIANGTVLRGSGAGWTAALPSNASHLTDRNISALAFAPDGTLYVGFFDRGIDLVSPEGSIRHLEDDHLFCINRLALDPERHTIAAATANGLVLFDAQGTPRQTLTRRDGLISDHVTDIAFTPAGAALATPAGISFVGPTGTESLYAFQGLVNNHVYTLASGAGPDQLLAGTLGGISIVQSKTVQRNLTISNSTLKHNWITALLPMPDSTTLVGTYGAGLETLDSQGRFAPVELPAGTPRNLVINPNALYATPSHIFAGTLGGGLLVYSVASGRWSAIMSGLPSENVTAFAAHAGELYVGTENGLVRIREAHIP